MKSYTSWCQTSCKLHVSSGVYVSSGLAENVTNHLARQQSLIFRTEGQMLLFFCIIYAHKSLVDCGFSTGCGVDITVWNYFMTTNGSPFSSFLIRGTQLKLINH